MTKQRIQILIPLSIVAGLLIYSWVIILFTVVLATWRNYIGLLLFLPLPYLYFKNLKLAILSTGIILIAGTLNLFTLTPSVQTSSYGVKIVSFEIWTPELQLPALGILVLYFCLNFNSLINIYLDYQERREKKKV
jgi:hypothetical protein